MKNESRVEKRHERKKKVCRKERFLKVAKLKEKCTKGLFCLALEMFRNTIRYWTFA